MASHVFESIATKQIDVGTEQFQAGKTGRPAYFHAETNVKLGGWFNAAKAYMDFGTGGTGEITGAASAFNAELRMPNKTMTGGSYTSSEVNLIFQANTVLHGDARYATSLAKFKISGDNAAMRLFEDSADACLFQIDGFDEGANSVIDLTGAPGGAVDGSIKIMINDVAWYIPIYDGS